MGWHRQWQWPGVLSVCVPFFFTLHSGAVWQSVCAAQVFPVYKARGDEVGCESRVRRVTTRGVSELPCK